MSNSIFLKGAPTPGYLNLTGEYEERKSEENLENKRIYYHSQTKSLLVSKDIIIDAFINGTTILYDPYGLLNYFYDNHNKRKKILKQIPSQLRYKVVVNRAEKIYEKWLVDERGLYAVIELSKDPELETLRIQLYNAIKYHYNYINKEIVDVLKQNCYLSFFDPDVSLKDMLSTIIMPNCIKESLMRISNLGKIFIYTIYSFPTIDNHLMFNENNNYYITNIDKVEIHNKLNFGIKLDVALDGIALAFKTIPINIFDDIKYDIEEGNINLQSIECDEYFTADDLYFYLTTKYKKGIDIFRIILEYVFSDSDYMDDIVNDIINNYINFGDVLESYSYDYYIKYMQGNNKITS